jgi:hypothetical protein
VESKNLARIAIYTHYKQAEAHGTHQPLLVVRQNRSKALAVVDLEYFVGLVRRAYASTSV